MRLPNPLRKARCTNTHTTQAGKPLIRIPRQLKMARNRPMVATLPRSRYRNGLASSRPRRRRPIVWAACRLPCIATSATPGSPSRLVMSPTANTSGCPGRVRSGSTSMRPARSTCAPHAAASFPASGEACTPAAQITVRAAIRSLGAVRERHVDTDRVDAGDARAHLQLDPESVQLARRRPGQVVPERGQRLLAAVDDEHAHGLRIEGAEVAAQRCATRARAPGPRSRRRSGRRRRRRRSASRAAPGHRSRARRPRRRRRSGAAARARRRSSSFPARRARTRHARSTTGWRRPRRSGCRRGSPTGASPVAWRSRPCGRDRSPSTSASSTFTFWCLRSTWRNGGAIWPGERMPVATWYSSGWKRWWLRRSTSVTSTGSSAR